MRILRPKCGLQNDVAGERVQNNLVAVTFLYTSCVLLLGAEQRCAYPA